MEFLGDSIMQLVATEYLFIHFPDHHEGHLTVRSSLALSTRALHTFERSLLRPEQLSAVGGIPFISISTRVCKQI